MPVSPDGSEGACNKRRTIFVLIILEVLNVVGLIALSAYVGHLTTTNSIDNLTDLTYIIWGRDSCGRALTFYTGFTMDMQTQPHRGTQPQCVMKSPATDSPTGNAIIPTLSKAAFNLQDVVPEQNPEKWKAVDRREISCAVCGDRGFNQMVIFGAANCRGLTGNGWGPVYDGYTMASQQDSTLYGSKPICVDRDPDNSTLNNVTTFDGSPQYGFVRSGDGFTDTGRLIPCVLCVKFPY